MRVRVDVQQKYHGRIRGLHMVRDLLRDSGVTLDFESDAQSDLLFIQDLVATQKKKVLPPIPMVVYERYASSVISPFEKTRRLLRQGQVKYWVKEMAAREPRLHNAKMIDGRYHFALLQPNDERAQKPSILVKGDTRKKILPLLPMFLQERYNDLRDGKVPSWRDRPIDIFCAGYLHDDFDILGRHRRQALRLVEASNRNYISISGKLIPQQMYYEILRNTKIFVSPYGLGEYSFKDFEAIFAGCLLVKPDSSFCTCHSLDVFGGGYCVQLKPDMSDFNETLTNIYDNLKDYRNMAARASEELRTAFQPEDYAREILKVFTSAVES
jgi:hypothetical protein